MSYQTFGWTHVSYTCRLPDDCSDVLLILGLEKVKGEVWFDDLEIIQLPSKPPGFTYTPPARMYKGHTASRLRGAMIGTTFYNSWDKKQVLENIRVLSREWKANVVRWQLTWTGMYADGYSPKDVTHYQVWLNKNLEFLDVVLEESKEYGIAFIIDLHVPPGGRVREGFTQNTMFREKQYQDSFIETWKKIARRYKDIPHVYAYDIVNEPIEGEVSLDCLDWNNLAYVTSQAIRAIDPETTLIIEPGRGGGPDGLHDFYPLDIPGVVYSVHMYIPAEYTYQRIYDRAFSYDYPGTIQGIFFDKETLKIALKPVREFQEKYNVHIVIGEFSAIRWAKNNSACRYISDCIDIFEEYQWDWVYHAFREWDGWSVEHTANPRDSNRSKTPTCRERLLRSWFERNEHP